MNKHSILPGAALLLLAACSGTRNDRSAGYDPCEQMKEEAETVETLERQLGALRAEARAGGDGEAAPDSARKVTAESLLVQKQDVLALALQAMQESARDCEIRSQPFDLYRTPPEREERL